MFKRKYVKISSEKVTQKIEDFLRKEGWHESLHPIELYAFRYALSGMKININNSSIIKKIGLNDIASTFKSSKFIIFSENDKYGCKNDADILDIYSNLDKRMIFLKFSYDGKYIEKICIYLPSQEDTTLILDNATYYINNIRLDCTDFIEDLSKFNKNLFKYHLQDDKIIPTHELNYDKEFFSFTNLDISGSTIIFHYVP